MGTIPVFQNKIKTEIQRRILARNHFLNFTKYMMPAYQDTFIHINYSNILNYFAEGKIKKLIITMPPQHGKSDQSSRRLPAFMLGINPDLAITVSSYSTTFARKFSTQIQRIIAEQGYNNLFPKTTISKTKFTEKSYNKYARTKDEFEIVNHKGILRAVGRGGALTGNLVDVMIMDDLYKDYAEGNSPVIRESVIDWYISVVRTRLHNQSQELIVFTRWHEEDLIGYIEKKENVEILCKKEQLENLNSDIWYKINFPAIATSECKKNEFDLRDLNVPLWSNRHSLEKLKIDRVLDSEKFESLYQGDPIPKKGLLYVGFNIYVKMPNILSRNNYTDVADTGKDYLCSICYNICEDNCIYITDIIYTQEDNTITEQKVATMFNKNRTGEAVIESNSGGRAFGRNVDRLSGFKHTIIPYFQNTNKESRILTNASELQRIVYFPMNWTGRWVEFARDLLKFKKNFKANKHDDAPDALTGCLEHSGLFYDSSEALWRR